MSPTALRLLGFGAGAVVFALLPLFVSDFSAFQLTYVGIYFIALVGLNILTGYTGLISLGHGAFVAIGAYTTAILTTRHDWNDLLTLPVAGLVAGAVGFAFGFPALRFAGVYLALATFAIPIAIVSLAKRFEGFTGGGGGINLALPKAELGVHTSPQNWLYYVTWTVAGVLFLAAFALLSGRSGRAFRAIRDSEVAAVSSGIDLAVWKTLSFGVSAFYAGVAGALLAIAAAYVNPDTFPISLSILLLVGVVVGGLGSLGGMIIGALFIEYVPLDSPIWIGSIADRLGVGFDEKTVGVSALVYGVILMLVLFVAPSGAAGLLRGVFRPWSRRVQSRTIANQRANAASKALASESPSGQVTSPRSDT